MTDPKLRTLTGLLANEQTQPTLCHHSETSLHPPATSPRSACRVYDCILCLRSRSVAPVRPVAGNGGGGPQRRGCARPGAQWVQPSRGRTHPHSGHHQKLDEPRLCYAVRRRQQASKTRHASSRCSTPRTAHCAARCSAAGEATRVHIARTLANRAVQSKSRPPGVALSCHPSLHVPVTPPAPCQRPGYLETVVGIFVLHETTGPGLSQPRLNLLTVAFTDRETQAVGSGDGRACGERRRSSLQTLASIVPLAQEASATMGRLEEYEVMKVRQDACVHCQRTDAAVRRPLRAYYCSLRGIKYSLTAVCAYFLSGVGGLLLLALGVSSVCLATIVLPSSPCTLVARGIRACSCWVRGLSDPCTACGA